MTKQIKTNWITGLIARHADFGGGFIAADMPDTPANRASVIKVLLCWSQWVDA